jgi:hypothetical protein
MNYRSTLVAVAQTLLLFVSGFFIPIIGWIITPIPLVLITVRTGRTEGLTALGISSLIIMFLGEWYIAFFFLLIFGLIAICTAESLIRQWKPESAVLLGGLIPIAVLGLIMAYYFSHMGKNPVGVVETFFQDQRTEAATLYGSLGFTEMSTTISSISASSILFFVLLLPCVVTLTLASIAACCYTLARSFIVRRPGTGPRLLHVTLASWYAPDSWVWGLIVALTLFLVPTEIARFTGWNFVIVFAALYLIQGIALADYLLKIKMHMNSVVRVLIHAIILILPPLTASAVILGIVDIWADFRKVRSSILKT